MVMKTFAVDTLGGFAGPLDPAPANAVPWRGSSFHGCARGIAAGSVNGGISGFTLIELILVMTILTIAVSVTAPSLANFFRGRTLDSEGRRLLSLTRQGQSRAVSEGIPVELWVDSKTGKFGLEAEPSYESTDTKAIEFTLDTDLQLEAANDMPGRRLTAAVRSPLSTGNPSIQPQILSRHPELPRIRFLPDGTIAESSPRKLIITGRDGFSISLQQSQNGLHYELARSN